MPRQAQPVACATARGVEDATRKGSSSARRAKRDICRRTWKQTASGRNGRYRHSADCQTVGIAGCRIARKPCCSGAPAKLSTVLVNDAGRPRNCGIIILTFSRGPAFKRWRLTRRARAVYAQKGCLIVCVLRYWLYRHFFPKSAQTEPRRNRPVKNRRKLLIIIGCGLYSSQRQRLGAKTKR